MKLGPWLANNCAVALQYKRYITFACPFRHGSLQKDEAGLDEALFHIMAESFMYRVPADQSPIRTYSYWPVGSSW